MDAAVFRMKESFGGKRHFGKVGFCDNVPGKDGI